MSRLGTWRMEIDAAELQRAKDCGACYGNPTLSTWIGMGNAQECVVCGTAVVDDKVDDPFWGFSAGCDYYKEGKA